MTEVIQLVWDYILSLLFSGGETKARLHRHTEITTLKVLHRLAMPDYRNFVEKRKHVTQAELVLFWAERSKNSLIVK